MVDPRFILLEYQPYWENFREVDGRMLRCCSHCHKPIPIKNRLKRFCDDECESKYYREWGWTTRKIRVFKRDGGRCQYIHENGDKCNEKLMAWWTPYDEEHGYDLRTAEIHHIIQVAEMPYVVGTNFRGTKKEYLIALKKALLDERNLITLCSECHKDPRLHRNLSYLKRHPFFDGRMRIKYDHWGHRQIRLEVSIYGCLLDKRYAFGTWRSYDNADEYLKHKRGSLQDFLRLIDLPSQKMLEVFI